MTQLIQEEPAKIRKWYYGREAILKKYEKYVSSNWVTSQHYERLRDQEIAKLEQEIFGGS